MEPWWNDVLKMIVEGRVAEAAARTRAAARSGSLAAQVRLAYLGEEAGIDRAEGDRLIRAAEEAVQPEDATCHWALYGAYEVSLGDCEYEERSRRALQHLEAFAIASGDSQAAFAVGVNYLNGRLGVDPSRELAVDWLHCAAALGHQGATKVLRDLGNA